jgi:transposase
MFLSNPQWLLLQPLFPTTSRGRPPLDARPILENIFWKLTTRQPWYDIPTLSPSWQTCYQHYHRWKHSGVWKSILKILMTDLYERGKLDLQAAFESRSITMRPKSCSEFDFTYPPELEGTWQLSTALLLLVLFSSGL